MRFSPRRLIPLLLLSYLTVPYAFAQESRTLDWDGLVPLIAYPQNPLSHLDEETQYEIADIADIRSMAGQGQLAKDDKVYKSAEATAKSLAMKGLDVDDLVRKYENLRAEVSQANRTVVNELDGQNIRIPGYALPLEFSGEAVSEFLLVPYVGACIHTPPPPPNQMIFVTVEKPFIIGDLYTPVWVTGRVSVQSATKSLSFVDGEASVDTGYAMAGAQIEPYKKE